MNNKIQIATGNMNKDNDLQTLHDLIDKKDGRYNIDNGLPEINEQLNESLKGKDEQEVINTLKQMNASYRIASRDGQHYILTMDYRPDRINLHIKDNKLASYTFG